MSPSPTGVSRSSRWRTSVSLRNALTKRFRSPSGPMSCDSRPGCSDDEAGHDLADRAARDLDLLGAAGRDPQRRRDADRAHASPPSQRSKADRLGPDRRGETGLTGTGDTVAVPERPGVRRLEPVAGQQRDDLVAGPDDAASSRRGGRGQGHAAGRLRVDALEPGDVADRRGGHLVVDRLDRAAGLVGQLDHVAAVGRIADGQRADDRVRASGPAR